VELACPVRDCGTALERGGRAWHCARGHAFDVARSGYCNLLQPQDRRSSRYGDEARIVEARHRWLERGLGLELANALEQAIDALALRRDATVLDAGCGDGYFLERIAESRQLEVCGIDLSIPAIRLAAKRMPGATWLVANADRRLPLQDASVDLVLSLFGRRNGAEFARVLRPPGHLLVAVPGEDDLVELRQAVQGRGVRRDRSARAIEDLAAHFDLERRQSVRQEAELDREAIEDALAMSYRGARTKERARAQELASLRVTLSAELLLFVKSGS
jgi:23S rRNA (guanine745-N1)-methyltransferase